MAHCCPNCKESAPVLFRHCPECGFDMVDCLQNGCSHHPKTMGEKYSIDNGECVQCGSKWKTCDCYD